VSYPPACFIELFSKSDRQRILPLLDAAIPSTPDPTAGDTLVTLNDKDVLLNILPVEDDEHESMMIILNDVTEKKRLEDRNGNDSHSWALLSAKISVIALVMQLLQ